MAWPLEQVHGLVVRTQGVGQFPKHGAIPSNTGKPGAVIGFGMMGRNARCGERRLSTEQSIKLATRVTTTSVSEDPYDCRFGGSAL